MIRRINGEHILSFAFGPGLTLESMVLKIEIISVMPDFSKRSSALEIMDDLNIAGQMMDHTLHELEIINKWLGGNPITIGALNLLNLIIKPERCYNR